MLDGPRRSTACRWIAITSHPRSPIARQSDVVLRIGAIKEPCSLGLTPSSSTTAMMALGDALALVLMDRKRFTKADYAKFHHGGYLGRRARKEARQENSSMRPEPSADGTADGRSRWCGCD